MKADLFVLLVAACIMAPFAVAELIAATTSTVRALDCRLSHWRGRAESIPQAKVVK